VDALHRLARRGFVGLRRDYVPYLEHSLDAQPDFPDEDPERSFWMGETGIRLVLQRLAPSQANLERLSELIAANERDERCELMWGSPGTILAGRELGLDVSSSIQWLHDQRDAEGLWTQHMYGQTTRYLGPAHGLAGCVLALGDVTDVWRRSSLAVEEMGSSTGCRFRVATRRRKSRRPDPHAVVPWRPESSRRSPHLDGEARGGVDVAPAMRREQPSATVRRERIRIPALLTARRRTVVTRRARSPCTPRLS
jgi:hypothetical protein